jgi:hypothetical protein
LQTYFIQPYCQYSKHIASNEWLTIDELERICKEAVIAQFKALSGHSSGVRYKIVPVKATKTYEDT